MTLKLGLERWVGREVRESNKALLGSDFFSHSNLDFASIVWYLLIHQMCGKLSFYSIFFPFNFLGVFLPSSWV